MSKPEVNSLRSPLGRVRGLGSAKSGTHHWWMMRVTSVALLPLFLWFVYACFVLAGASYAETKAFVGSPVNAVLFLLLIGFLFHHIANGLQEVVEDYVRPELKRMLWLFAIKGLSGLLAMIAAFSVLRVAFT